MRVGPLPVLWLPADKEVPSEEIQSLLREEEHQRAREIKAQARRREYERVRWLLRKASGFRGPLPHQASGAPVWPEGYVGSITHKEGICALTLGRAREWLGVGLDCERCAKVRPEFEERLADESESALLCRLEEEGTLSRSELLAGLFSFKEALFKCHFPLGGRMFWFRDARIVEWEGGHGGRVVGEVLIDTSPKTPKGHKTQGRVYFKGDYVISSAWLPNN